DLALVVLVQLVVEDTVVISLRRGLLESGEQSHESSLLLFAESGVEAAGGPESSGPAVAVVKCFDDVEVGVCDPLDHQLGDAVAAGHTQRGLRVEVDQRNPDLATVAGIDGARR